MNFAILVRCLKKHAIDKGVSDEDFINDLIAPFVNAGKIKDKNKNDFHLNKSRCSLIMNNVEDVPGKLRKSLNMVGIYHKTEEGIEDFIDDYLLKDELGMIVSELEQMIEDEIEITDKDRLLNKAHDIQVFLADVLLETFRLDNRDVKYSGELIRNGRFYVSAISDDILNCGFRDQTENKSIVVIPVDTEFHTHVTKQYEKNPVPQVSPKSIHGQWLIKWEESGQDIEDLLPRIKKSINNLYGIECDCNKYPLGTIAVIENESSIFYLLAISDFDKSNNAHSSPQQIKYAIDELTKFYDKHGESNDLYIPLLGTGKARANISLQDSFDFILENLNKHKNRIQGNIKIVIYKDNLKYVNIGGI